MKTKSFTIKPLGGFSLQSAIAMEFGSKKASKETVMRLAFCVDGFREHAGVELRQDGTDVIAEVHGAKDLAAVQKQVERVLSLDFDGSAWAQVGRRDKVIGAMQKRFVGFRPVLHYSAYEAAAWGVLTGRRGQRQAAVSRARIAAEFGETFELAGEKMGAFPIPERLLQMRTMQGLVPVQIERLHGIAKAALDGKIDPVAMREAGPERAREIARSLPGIGEFYSALIANRAVGFTDALATDEPKSLACVRHYYKLGRTPSPRTYEELAECWRPFRNWAAVLMRRTGYADGVA